MIASYAEEQFSIMFWFCTSAKELDEKKREDYPDSGSNGSCRGRTSLWSTDDRTNICIYASSPAVLAHECVHAANFILDLVGQQPDIDNDEFYCYLVGHIFRQYCKHVRPTWNKETWKI